MPYQRIDPLKLRVWSLSERESLFDWSEIAQDPQAPPAPMPERSREQVRCLAERINHARRNSASVMLTYGAHLIKNGCGPLLNWLVEKGWVSHLATQGAGIIHDWEYAFWGASSESVEENTRLGRFGSWDETGKFILLSVFAGCLEGMGFGEAIGRLIQEDGVAIPNKDLLAKELISDPSHPLAAAKADMLRALEQSGLEEGPLRVPHPNKAVSVSACCYRRRIPLTVHPGIGYDIFVNHPLFSGAALGRAAETDVRIFAQSCCGLSGGVYLSIGSAIMSPQVFEKALSAANNLRLQEGLSEISGHYIAIADIQPGGCWDWSRGEPPDDHPSYYLRFCKSFYRMGGTVDYLCCDNRVLLSNLVAMLKQG
jgi:hypothetical protein